MSPMRVLMVTHQYFPRHVGGTEVLVRALAREASRGGDLPTVLTHVALGPADVALSGPRESELDGVRVIELLDLERVSRLLDRLREALDRLYRSRRWRVANPLRNLDEQLRDTARARGGSRLAYRPLERAWTALRSAVTEIQQRALMFGESPDLAVYAWWLSTRRSASASPVPARGGGREISFLLVLPDDPRRDGSDLSATIHSVLGQTYPRWTLWLLASDRGRARDEARFPEDPRIRRIPPDATRETWPADVTHVAAIAPGDLLEPDALAAVARVAADPGSPDLIYTDEDRIDARGIPHDPFYQPHLNDQHADFTLVPLTSRACGRARDTGSPRRHSPG